MDGLSEQQVGKLLEQDYLSLMKLRALLEQEQQLLAHQQLEQLPPLLAEKSRLLDEMESHHLQVVSYAGERKPVKYQWENYLANVNQRKSALGLKIPRLLDLFSTLEHLNKVNGRIAARMQNNFNEIMRILRRDPASPLLYSASGHTHQTRNSNPYASTLTGRSTGYTKA